MEQHFTILTSVLFGRIFLHCGNPEKYSHEDCTKVVFTYKNEKKSPYFEGKKKFRSHHV
jgi:hypothetical protein